MFGWIILLARTFHFSCARRISHRERSVAVPRLNDESPPAYISVVILRPIHSNIPRLLLISGKRMCTPPPSLAFIYLFFHSPSNDSLSHQLVELLAGVPEVNGFTLMPPDSREVRKKISVILPGKAFARDKANLIRWNVTFGGRRSHSAGVQVLHQD